MRDFDAWIAFLDARRRAPFAWGRARNDCVSHGNDGVLALTGRDWLAELDAPVWSSERGALRALRQFGGLEGAVDRAFARRRAAALAQRGDLALVRIEDRTSLVFFEGDSLVGPGPEGHFRLPRRMALIAWDVDPS